jgi:hypothetical protein
LAGASNNVHPYRNNTARGNDPLFGLIVIWRYDTVSRDFAETPCNTIKQDERNYTRNDTISNTEKSKSVERLTTGRVEGGNTDLYVRGIMIMVKNAGTASPI